MRVANSVKKARSLKLYHELMTSKVVDILLVSSPYDAFIMEEEGRLSTRIINEYKGLNLSRPPRLTRVSSMSEAFEKLALKKFDLILAMPSLDGTNVYQFAQRVKKRYTEIPFFMLLHNTCDVAHYVCQDSTGAIDRTYIWNGNADLLLAIIKNFEDDMNVAKDTQNADVRVIILVEDSPYHYSSILPVLYKQIVLQTQTVIDESINEEHRLLKMRGRPKVLVAHNYEDAIRLYETYKPYLLSVFSDIRYQRKGIEDPAAGLRLLTKIKRETPDLPLLVLSTEEQNREKSEEIPAVFINKMSSNLNNRIKSFFVCHLGFGDFIFRMPDGKEIARASDLRTIEKLLDEIPDESIVHHAMHDDFSRWFMARSEIEFALQVKPYTIDDFPDPQGLKHFLIEKIRQRRMGSRKGQIIDFDPEKFDSDTDFMKIGSGSLGGKARGLAFMASQIKLHPELHEKFPDITITIPQTVVISTEGFKMFIEENGLSSLLDPDVNMGDDQIIAKFLQARFPDSLKESLKAYLENVRYPIAVRSSSLFEDAHYQPFAGMYNTYMLANSNPIFQKRLDRLILAIKLVYASTYLKAPRSYAKSTMHRTEDEEMAVVLQQLTGAEYNNYFYPSISGVAQSYNFYPISHLKSDDGISYIALGLGKVVMEGGKTLRVCPKYPQFLPQFSIVDDILENSQKYFYALKVDEFPDDEKFINSKAVDPTLVKLDLNDATDHPVIRELCSTFHFQDNRIRDSFSNKGFPVLTFASILKYNSFPLTEILEEVTRLGCQWMGTSVEVEFAVNLPRGEDEKADFSLLQIRPMGQYTQNLGVKIGQKEIKKAFCYSERSLGNGEYEGIYDLVYVDPETFDAAQTVEIAAEVNKINSLFNSTNQKYVLIGPGRWGSADRWLGIPVVWNDISNAGVIVETTIESIKADPSQGSHFFQNITSLGISYITVSNRGKDFIDYEYFKCSQCDTTTRFLKHIRFDNPIKILVDGKTSQSVMMPYEENEADKMDDIPVFQS
ncbi:MAG: phosphoenolpyruvate synthase PpsA [Desulfobacterales bacterium]|nr:phosphoenolpyruvate synthase PpsA [Desulfobacterales bacterium]